MKVTQSIMMGLAQLVNINPYKERSVVAARAAAAVMRDRLEDRGVDRNMVADAHTLAEWQLLGPRYR